jgi:selenocysteine lyase/cysteine desulfurase
LIKFLPENFMFKDQACGDGWHGPLIRHFGLESSVRPSLAFYNTGAEVDALVLALRSLKRS